MVAPGRHRRASYRTVYQVQSRAWTVSSLWWLSAAAVYVLIAIAQPGPQTGCQGDECWSWRGLLLALGVVAGLPVLAVGMALSALVIAHRAKRARSGAALGTWVAWLGFGSLVALWALGVLALR